MTLDITFFAFAIPAVLFAGISKGGFGSGAAFAATPFLALILEPSQAVGLMLPLLMLMDVGALRPYWRRWNWPAAQALIVGSIPGIVAGALLFSVADPDVFKFLIGTVAVGFVLFQLAKARGWLTPPTQELPTSAGYLAGAVAGFTSFISHAGGPPAAIYLLSKKLDKTTFQATTVITFWAINLFKFGPYLAVGIVSKETFWADLFLAPFAFIGVWIGVVLHRKMPERAFFGLTYAFLLITGSKLIWEAVF